MFNTGTNENKAINIFGFKSIRRIAFSDISGIAFSYFYDQITTCCNKSDGLSHDELSALSSVQIAILHKHQQGRRKKRWINMQL